MTQDLRDVLTALATPFDSDEQIDVSLLQQVVNRSIDGGVDGVVVGGSTGEFAALSTDERIRLVNVVAERTAGRVPVIAQTGATGVNLDPDTVGSLAQDVENVKYIKDSSANWEQALQLIHHHGHEIGTFIGWDAYIYSALVEGAAGVMAGTANVVPAEIVSVARAIAAGELGDALAQWKPAVPGHRRAALSSLHPRRQGWSEPAGRAGRRAAPAHGCTSPG